MTQKDVQVRISIGQIWLLTYGPEVVRMRVTGVHPDKVTLLEVDPPSGQSRRCLSTTEGGLLLSGALDDRAPRASRPPPIPDDEATTQVTEVPIHDADADADADAFPTWGDSPEE